MEYEERLVAYIDIIGWQACINKDKDVINPSVVKAMEVLQGLYKIHTAEYKKELQKKYNNVNPAFLAFEVALFSDNIIISTPVSFGMRTP